MDIEKEIKDLLPQMRKDKEFLWNHPEEEFKEIVEKEKIELNKTTKDKVFEAISKYYLYVLIPITLISAIYITLIVRAKRGKNQ